MKYLLLLCLCSCASITSGTMQSISMDTSPVHEAKCSLSNEKGKWFIPSTPGTVTIQRSSTSLEAMCEVSGYQGSLNTESSLKAISFGNVLFGGPIGVIVDVSSGSAYEYPQNIMVPMTSSEISEE